MGSKFKLIAGVGAAVTTAAAAALVGKRAMGKLDVKRVLLAKPKEHEAIELTPLTTIWGAYLDKEDVLSDHPSPQMAREAVQVLNGTWRCAFVKASDLVGQLSAEQVEKLSTRQAMDELLERCIVPDGIVCDTDILVPFSPEASLSGVGRQLQPGEALVYRRLFRLDDPLLDLFNADGCVQLNFEAVDYACAVWLNGHSLGRHLGGYTPFVFDVSPYLLPGDNVLTLVVLDPSEKGTQLRGKQRLNRGDIWYTSQSGIWKTVWLEAAPKSHIVHMDIDSFNLDGRVTIKVDLEGEGALSAVIRNSDGVEVARDETRVAWMHRTLVLRVPEPSYWSPDNPVLYDIEVRFGDDLVKSYCAFRTTEVSRDSKGIMRFKLNGEPYFLRGVLDQGYWPDGLMTAPSDEALIFDIRAMKTLGFNMLRKHIKIESSRWYYHCDRLGMMVWQDMVCGGDLWNSWYMSYQPTVFQASWDAYEDVSPAHQANLLASETSYREEWTRTCKETVEYLKDSPCVVTWVLFNEGWGQFDAKSALDMVRQVDPSRPVDAVSGWYDQRCGDFKSVHNYFRPQEVWLDEDKSRAFVVSEFGGLTYPVPGHCAFECNYGYATYDNAEAWRFDVNALLDRMDSLEEKGLAGYVYTQLSDVEEETNGILTYDRRVNKLD